MYLLSGGDRGSTIQKRLQKGAGRLRDPGPFKKGENKISLLKKLINTMTTQGKRAIDSAISQGLQPKAGSGGLGLVLPIPGARFRVLYDKNGITKLGKYYYQKTGLPEPKKFDFT